MFSSHHGTVYCSDACRFQLRLKVRHCKACGQGFISYGRPVYCSDECRHGARAPAIYRFICPDGRSYVGGVKDYRHRADNGIARFNLRLDAAFAQYPPETWTFEVLERLSPGCSELKLRRAEQRHINRLRSWDAEHGFNIAPAYRSERDRAIIHERGAAARLSRNFGIQIGGRVEAFSDSLGVQSSAESARARGVRHDQHRGREERVHGGQQRDHEERVHCGPD
jgi:hypothetical protein